MLSLVSTAQQFGIADVISLACGQLGARDYGPMNPPRLLARKAIRPILFAAGCIFLVVGVAGLVLPLVPGTLFLIIAAACFARSSPRFEGWLLGHPRFGPAVQEWRRYGSIPRRAKVLAISAMALSLVLTWMSGAPPIAIATTAILLLGAAVYVATRPVTPR